MAASSFLVYPPGCAVGLWPREPTPPRPLRPPRYRIHAQGSSSSGGTFDTCGLWERSQAQQPVTRFNHASLAPASEAYSVYSSSSSAAAATSGRRLCCDRCDEAHETEHCPHFKQKRGEHTDSWLNFNSPVRDMKRSAGEKTLSAGIVQKVRMPGDGSCLFHAFAYGVNRIFGTLESGSRVRRRAADFIASNPEFEITGTALSSWVQWDSQLAISSYASRLSAGGFWGGAIEMAALAKLFCVDVAVYEEDYFRGLFHRISDFVTDEPRGTVLLLYSGRSHYDALEYAGPEARSYRRPAVGLERQEDQEWCQLM